MAYLHSHDWVFRPLAFRRLVTDKRSTEKDGRWHNYNPWFFVRLGDGSLSNAHGQISRRWVGGKWEYRQAPETEEEFDARQY